jgi:hypothetical protein
MTALVNGKRLPKWNATSLTWKPRSQPRYSSVTRILSVANAAQEFNSAMKAVRKFEDAIILRAKKILELSKSLQPTVRSSRAKREE